MWLHLKWELSQMPQLQKEQSITEVIPYLIITIISFVLNLFAFDFKAFAWTTDNFLADDNLIFETCNFEKDIFWTT